MILENTESTVPDTVVIVTINPSASKLTDLVQRDVLLDTRGLFVLTVSTIFEQ